MHLVINIKKAPKLQEMRGQESSSDAQNVINIKKAPKF